MKHMPGTLEHGKEDMSNTPNPKEFAIIQIKQINNHVVAKLQYPNCRNHNGLKILVWENTNLNDITMGSYIDPIMSINDVKLIAEFIPTEYGWKLAEKFIENL